MFRLVLGAAFYLTVVAARRVSGLAHPAGATAAVQLDARGFPATAAQQFYATLLKETEGPKVTNRTMAEQHIQEYTKLGYKSMNRQLNSKFPLTIDMKEKVVRLVESMQFGELPPPVVYRSSNVFEFSEADVGSTKPLRAFTSTTTNEKAVRPTETKRLTVYSYPDEMAQFLEIHTHPSRSGARDISSLSAMQREGEVVFPPRTHFTVLAVSSLFGISHVTLEEVF